MKRKFYSAFLAFTCFISWSIASGQNPESVSHLPQGLTSQSKSWALVIHGGAGGPAKGTMTEEQEKAYLVELGVALELGAKILSSDGSSMDAVETVVKYLEDCPLFNAGKGAVLNADGIAELDASIMDGLTGKAGAVAGVKTLKNPIMAARKVMENSNHVMLAGAGADQFGKEMGLATVNSDYFITPQRQSSWEKWKQEKKGTVGAVALDTKGNLAAATSTGGMTGKMPGRIGDSPIIGAGTYASNRTCAVSATGHGEYFIRNVVAYDLSAKMEYGKLSLKEAAGQIIFEKLKSQDASGGLIAIDRAGNIAMPFNTNAMFRGFIRSDGSKETSIY